MQYFKRKELGALFAEVSLFYLAFSSFVSGFALFSERRFFYHGVAFGPRQIGYLFAYFGFLGIILQGFLVGPLVKKFGERRMARFGFLSAMTGYFLVGLIHSPYWIILTGIFSGFGNGVVRPTLTSLISQSADKKEQGVVLGINQSLSSVAQVLAPIAGGYFIEQTWLTVWAWIPAALSLMGALLMLRNKRKGARVVAV